MNPNPRESAMNTTLIYKNIPKRDILISKMRTSTEYLHSPTLETVLMIERTIQGAGELISVAELKRRLPRKVMHQTLLHVLDYLQYSGKIVLGTKGILWIFTERKELNNLISQGLEL